MTTNEGQPPEHPPRPNWNAREMAIVLSLGLLVLSVAIDLMVDNQIDWRAFLADLPPNIVGALIVFWLFEWMYSARQQEELKAREAEEATEQLKRDLIVRMGSRVKDTALSAAEELSARGWLHDGSLKGANLSEANLEGANLNDANLFGANLIGTNLIGTYLYVVNLQEAYLWGANLQRAILWRVDLQRADLRNANLEGADLLEVNLQGVDLWHANLQGVDLGLAEFDEDTRLPDGSCWTPGIDLTRFTDPDHPNFWRSEFGFVWQPISLEEGQDGDD